MTVFTLSGARIATNQDGYIVAVAPTELDVITRTGSNYLETVYWNPTERYLVSLADYNLVFDGVHINDGELPTQIELFDLVSDGNKDVRVINFVFATENGMEELMFSVGKEPLPEFLSPAQASAFFERYQPQVITNEDNFTIQLDQITGVKTQGVFAPPSQLDGEALDDTDSFEFILPSDGQGIATFENIAQGIDQTLEDPASHLLPDPASDEPIEIFNPEPSEPETTTIQDLDDTQ